MVDSKPVIVKPDFTTKGGNLTVLMSSDFQTLDPGNSNAVTILKRIAP